MSKRLIKLPPFRDIIHGLLHIPRTGTTFGGIRPQNISKLQNQKRKGMVMSQLIEV